VDAEFKSLTPTDFSSYDKDDLEHVGWYYIPVNNGKPTWMEPYLNSNINVYMISYVVPIVIDNVKVGIVGMDIDFKEMKINVDHQLQRYNGIGYKIAEPKTKSGIRQIPMTAEVAEAFRRIMKARVNPKIEPIIDGYAGFLFLDKDSHPMVAMHWEKYFQHICQKYNRIYEIQMPKVTPHVCRHTFCSKMAAARMNPKTLQYIMGHSDIGVTLNTYTHLGFEEASEEVRRMSSGG